MTYDSTMAWRVRDALAGELSGEPLTEKAMFGGLAFLVGGQMAVAVSGHGGLLVRIDPADADTLVAPPGVDRADMGRGPTNGWLRVADAAVDDDHELARWVRTGVERVRHLAG